MIIAAITRSSFPQMPWITPREGSSPPVRLRHVSWYRKTGSGPSLSEKVGWSFCWEWCSYLLNKSLKRAGVKSVAQAPFWAPEQREKMTKYSLHFIIQQIENRTRKLYTTMQSWKNEYKKRSSVTWFA